MKSTWRHFRYYTPDMILNELEVMEPPIPIFLIARQLGVNVLISPSKFDSILEFRGREAIVTLGQSQTNGRKRFMLAHALGHLVLHPTNCTYRDGGGLPIDNQQDQEANEFASNLLVPFWALATLMDVYKGNTKELAQRFQVTAGMMFRKLSKGWT